MDKSTEVMQKIERLQRDGKFDEASRVYFADLTCNWGDFPTDAKALEILQPFFANGIDHPPVIEDIFNQARLAVDLAHAFYRQGQLAEFETAYGVAFEQFMARNLAGNLQGHLIVFGNLIRKSNQLARAERAYQFSLRLAGDEGFAPGSCHMKFMELHVETGQWDRAADADTRYELAMPDTRDRVYEDAAMASFRAQMQIVKDGQPLSHSDWEKAKFIVQRYAPAHQRAAYWMGELSLRNDDLTQAADHFNTVIRLAEEQYAEQHFAVAARGGLAQLAALDEDFDTAHELALASGDDYAMAEVYRLELDREKAVQHAIEAYLWAWADGEPYSHAYQLEWAKTLLDNLGEPYPPAQPFEKVKLLPYDEKIRAFIEAQGKS